MKKLSKSAKIKINDKKGNTSLNININNNNVQKYDFYKLQSLLEELEKKDSEYDLIIKGLKEKINTTKRENNFLEKEIEQLKIDNINKTNKRLDIKNKYQSKEIENKIEFNNNMENLNNNNLLDKYKEELNKNKDIKSKIYNIQKEINSYKNRLLELESILNYMKHKLKNFFNIII